MKSLFIVDGSLDRPILHSQGIPLLKRLHQMGIPCYVQSFESSIEAKDGELGIDLANNNITWLPVLISKELSGWQRLQMIVKGFLQAYELCRSQKINVVHCRSYRPGVVGSLMKIFLGSGFLFDMRGFLIDEQLMLGRWKASGIKYEVARMLERWMMLNADAIIANSFNFREKVLNLPYFPKDLKQNLVISIPNCVDTLRFSERHPMRNEIREKMGWQNRLVIAFAGEARTWESFEYILEFYKTIREVKSTAYLALFAYGDLDELQNMLIASGLSNLDYCLVSIPPVHMPDYLGAADVGVVFRRDNEFIKAIVSPIKFAEYLSSGLPVVINPGIGETGRIVEQYKVGIVLDPQIIEQLKSGVKRLLDLIETDPGLRHRCHETAQKELSLDIAEEKYLQAYKMVATAADKRMKK